MVCRHHGVRDKLPEAAPNSADDTCYSLLVPGSGFLDSEPPLEEIVSTVKTCLQGNPSAESLRKAEGCYIRITQLFSTITDYPIAYLRHIPEDLRAKAKPLLASCLYRSASRECSLPFMFMLLPLTCGLWVSLGWSSSERQRRRINPQSSFQDRHPSHRHPDPNVRWHLA